MSKRLNTVDDMKMDNLIYDHFKIIDAKVVPVTVPDGAGTLRRGQLLDFDAEKKTFAVHASGGTANCIVCNDTEYTEEDSIITTSAYISGDFRKSEVISSVELDVVDDENLRSAGIILK